MTDGEAPASSRVTAAKVVLEMALKVTEMEDLTRRVEALEKLLRTNDKEAVV